MRSHHSILTDLPEDPARDERWVYFLQAGSNGRIKIGTSANPDFRLMTLQTAIPERLQRLGLIPGGHTTETYLHHLFGWLCVGGEWFKPSPFITEYITERALAWTANEEPQRWLWMTQELTYQLNAQMKTPTHRALAFSGMYSSSPDAIGGVKKTLDSVVETLRDAQNRLMPPQPIT